MEIRETLARHLSKQTNPRAEEIAHFIELCRPPPKTTISDPNMRNGIVAAAVYLSLAAPRETPQNKALLDIVLSVTQLLSVTPESPDKKPDIRVSQVAADPSTVQVFQVEKQRLIEGFCQRIATLLVKITAHCPFWKDLVITTFMQFYKEHHEREDLVYVKRGMFSAFANEGIFDFAEKDIAELCAVLDEDIAARRNDILYGPILGVFRSLSLLPNCPESLRAKWFDLAMSQSVLNGHLDYAIPLARCCARNNKEKTAKVANLLIASIENFGKSDSSDMVLFILKSADNLSIDNESHLPSLVEAVFKFLFAASKSNKEPIRGEACALLARMLSRCVAGGNIELARNIIKRILYRIEMASRNTRSGAALAMSPSPDGRRSSSMNLFMSSYLPSDAPAKITNEFYALNKIYTALMDMCDLPEFILGELAKFVSPPLGSVDKSIVVSMLGMTTNPLPANIDIISKMVIHVFKIIIDEAVAGGKEVDSFVDKMSDHFGVFVKEIATYIAKNPTQENAGVLKPLCIECLTFFQQLAQGVRKKDASIAPLRVMANLMPVLAALVDYAYSDELISDTNEDLRQLFRQVWFFCVYLRFTPQGGVSMNSLFGKSNETNSSSRWYQALVSIAYRMPAIIIGKNASITKIQLEFEELMKDSSIKTIIGKSMKGLFRNVDISIFPPHVCYYLLGVYYLEVLRARNGEFRTLFSYMNDNFLQDPHTQNAAQLSGAFRAIGNEMFQNLLVFFEKYNEAKGSSVGHAQQLIAFCNYLLVNYSSPIDAVRQAADDYISLFIAKFPHVLWTPECLETLLSLVDVVSKGCLLGPLDDKHVQIPGTQLFIDIPETTKTFSCQKLRELFCGLCERWLKRSMEIAPSETFNAVHKYIAQSNLSESHSGVALAAEVMSMKTAGSNASASVFSTTLSSRAKFRGMINGMVQMFKVMNPNDDDTAATDVIARSVLNRFKEYSFPDDKRKAFTEQEMNLFVGIMNQACALVVAFPHSKYIYDLISRVVWAPVRIFTRQAMDCAIACWNWLVSFLPYKEQEYLMTQINLAWSWTIDSRIGLFSDARRPPSPLSVVHTVEGNENEEWKKDHIPHRMWLTFIDEQLVLNEHGDFSHEKALFNMLYKACSDPKKLSALGGTFCTRIHMLMLALRLARLMNNRRSKHRVQGDNGVTEAILLKRVHDAAISWFHEFPCWIEGNIREELEEDLALVVRFCDELNANLEKYSSAPVAATQGQFPVAKMSTKGSLSSRHSKISGPSRKSNGSLRSVDIGAFLPVIVQSQNDGGAFVDSFAVYSEQSTRERVCLLLYLLADEIERTVVWNNPLMNPSKKVNIGAWEKYKKPILSWKKYVTAAWEVDPVVAVMLWIRKKNNDELKACVAEQVLAEPTAVLNCAEAVELLVTAENAEKNIPQLRYLLYWAPTTPPMAMSFLGPKFRGNTLVTQYALRVLKQFTGETIIFYIPQLVQCLRYDKSDMVANYLVEAAKRDELLAHQLIWNIRTYPRNESLSEDERIMNQAEQFADKAADVSQRIIAQFTDDERARYEKEFTFFDQFTEISSRLLPYPAEERRAQLKEELKKLPEIGERDTSVYLPFMPDHVVRSVDFEKGAVLRSAAKVPILVNFNVSHRNHLEKQSLHSCIFKSGDDCRQDMLALQIIELLKRMFDNSGLNLYLFPYHIIATMPGCGIIEVVPNSMSRDQLGQKTDGTMYDYFLGKYGARNTPEFTEARNNFIRSMGGYAIASYLLQVKDRHNGNILILEDGHLVHIDFGFLFDISPGGNLGFEKAPFKITEEMINIIGTGRENDQFLWFMEQGIRAFLASREYASSIETLVELMLDTQLPCFKPPTMENLDGRFFPKVTVTDAAKQMAQVMASAFSAYGTFFTYFYDTFQKFDNGIAM